MTSIISFCFIDYRNTLNHEASIAYSAEEAQIIEETLKDDSSFEMNMIQSAMGAGINLGNALDVCDWNYFGSNNSTGFQAAIVYNSAPWTAWDASQYKYFDNNGNLTITWDLSNIKSKSDSAADNFAIQLVNHAKNYQGTSVKCTIKSAVFTYPNGISEDLYSTSDSFELTVNKNVTQYFYFDLKHLGISTSNVKGGTVSISLTISDYYSDVMGKISKLETSWGNPLITKEMVQTVKNAGFVTVRIPVTYFNHISSDGTIDKEFLDRVEQVVDWVLESGMYCIIDIHHDTGNDGWIRCSESNYKKNRDMVGYIFRQIAERMKYKNDHLILEGLNETVNTSNQWNNIPASDLQTMNKWNQLFVDSVRSTGGNNSTRYLLVNTYAALWLEECLNGFSLPNDSVANRIFVGIHCYYKSDNMQQKYSIIQKYSEKYHFIIGEWAVTSSVTNRIDIAREYTAHTRELGIPAIWWDNGKTSEMAIFNRKELTWPYRDVVNVITGK